MIETFIDWLRNWNKAHSERVKLQHAYFVTTLGLALVAGLIGLIDVRIGRDLVSFAAIFGAVWVINSVAWALLQSFVLNRLKPNTRTNRRVKSKKK